MRNLSYNPDASGILSQVTSSCGNVEMPQEVQLVIKSDCEKEYSVKDNQDQTGQTDIIEDVDDEDHEMRKERVAKDIDKYLCELVQLGITEKVDTKTSTYDYDEPKSYEEAWYHKDPKQCDKRRAAITKDG